LKSNNLSLLVDPTIMNTDCTSIYDEIYYKLSRWNNIPDIDKTTSDIYHGQYFRDTLKEIFSIVNDVYCGATELYLSEDMTSMTYLIYFE
jgi:hypothetical protein